MKFAYLINAHKNASQVARLIERLNTSDTSFVIHVSKTAEKGFYEQITSLMNGFQNVHFCKREFSIHFGFGIVQATINGMELLLNKGIEFDYFHLLSGQDYPLKSNDQIFDFFNKNNGKEFMEFWKLFPDKNDQDGKGYLWEDLWQFYRVDRYSFDWLGKRITIPEIESKRLISHSLLKTIKIFLKKIPDYRKKGILKEQFWLLFFSRILPEERDYNTDFTMYGGKTWFSFTKPLIEHIVNEHKTTRKWKKFYRYTLIPDEMYFHTITMNSKFKDNVENNLLREVEWEGGDGTHPLVWGVNDFKRLQNTKSLWARKFEEEIDSSILDLIDKELLNL